MARGGINLALVREARAALLRRGRRPSIDAVRIELGNTGSKSTISRYLKELEASTPPSADTEPATVIDERLLSLVQTLRSELLDQTQVSLRQEQARGAEREEQLLRQVQALEAQHRAAQAQLAQSHQQLRDEQELRQQQAQDGAAKDEVLRREERKVSELKLTLKERDTQIEQLRASQRHAQENLEHFRQAGLERHQAQQRQHEEFRQDSHQQIRKREGMLIQTQKRVSELSDEVNGLGTSLALERQKSSDLYERHAQLERRVEQLNEERQQLLAARLANQEQLREVTALLSERSSQREQLIIDLALCQSRLATQPPPPAGSPADEPTA
ncbi:DNA-binding protein [Pseudomonas kribbensis]|uniref:DNA-binding protein n=1 Tax=Pseudomonas kribbensis TaxID=1628086 RepID=UPI003BF8A111